MRKRFASVFKFFIGLILLFKTGFAQNKHLDFTRSVIFYNLSTYELTKSIDTANTLFRYGYTQLNVFHPTIAFRWKTKTSNFHEVELTNFKFGSSGTRVEFLDTTTGNYIFAGDNYVLTTELRARYEFILTFNKTTEKSLVPSIGFAASPGFNRFDVIPSSASFPIKVHSVGLKGHVIPRLTWFFREKLYLDFNCPLNIFTAEYRNTKQLDPSKPIEQQKVTNFDFEMFPIKFSLRVGLGYKF